MEATEKGVLFKVVPRLENMADIDAEYGTPEEIKKKLKSSEKNTNLDEVLDTRFSSKTSTQP